MQSASFKKCLLGLMVCITLFCVCFTMNIFATGTDGEDSSSVSTEESSAAEQSLVETVDSNVSEADVSEPSEDVVSQAESSESSVSSQTVVSRDSNPSVAESKAEPSRQEESSLVVEAVSEGGAPDDDVRWFEEGADGSYTYDGSYAGLASSVNNEEASDVKSADSRSGVAQRYAIYAKIGMIVFGLLSLLLAFLLIWFNRNVARSKKLHPEWYPPKHKPKH